MSNATELKQLRISIGYSQHQVARETGYSQALISLMEAGKHEVDDGYLAALQRIVSPDVAIEISAETARLLDSLRHPGETDDQLLRRLCVQAVADTCNDLHTQALSEYPDLLYVP